MTLKRLKAAAALKRLKAADAALDCAYEEHAEMFVAQNKAEAAMFKATAEYLRAQTDFRKAEERCEAASEQFDVITGEVAALA